MNSSCRVALQVTLFLGISILSGGINSTHAKEHSAKKLHVRLDRSYNKKGENGQYWPVCLEMEKILNLPENFKIVTKIGDVIANIIFPQKFGNFAPVKWQPISIDEARHYFENEELDKILASDKNKAITLNHDWKSDSKFEFEKTTVDYDAHPPSETLIRYRYNPASNSVCLITNGAPDPARSNFNGQYINGNYGHALGAEGCEVFTYGGRVYLYLSGGGNYPAIIRPESEGYQNPAPRWVTNWAGPWWYVNHRQICRFQVDR